MSRYSSGGGGSSRRQVPSYQTSSSSSRNYSSSGGGGSLERDYSRSHLSGNGNSSSNYYSSSSRKPETGGGSSGYSYLEPNWIDKTRSSLPVDPYASNYLDRAPLTTSREYTTAAASAQPVYPSAAAAALSVGAYGANSSMPKAYARPDDYYRASAAPLAPSPAAHYGYSSAFEQSTMAAQAAAIYEMQNSKRDAWPATPHHHVVDYGGRREDERSRSNGGGDRRRDEGERRRDERRVEERRGGAESWRDRDRDVLRERERRPSLFSRERERERDLRVTVSSSTRRGGDDRREVRRADPPLAAAAARNSRHDAPRERDTRDASRRSIEKRAAADSIAGLDRESRDLERQLAKVQRELEQLESSGRTKGNSREKEKESERSSRRPAASSAPTRRVTSSPARGGPPRRTVVPPPRASMIASSYYSSHRTAAVRPTRGIGGGRSTRPSGQMLPSLLDAVVPRPGRRSAPVTRASRGSAVWEVQRRGAPPPPQLPSRGGPSASKRIGAAKRGTTATTSRFPPLSSREKVRRAKEKLRREEERRKRIGKKKEGRHSKENREKRKEEDFAWLETIMSEDEELDEETNRKLLLAPRQVAVLAIIDQVVVHPHTLETFEDRREGQAEEAEQMVWTAEEADAIELLPIIDLKAEVCAAFLASHQDQDTESKNPEPEPAVVVSLKATATPLEPNGDGKDLTMEE
ncbi:hypothetical protein PMAYCL1PPCAC_10128 [Pristionchus mayeri]|uniref:Uncharacterized protein n=1 Tax=Pristionchus mayeri TaxID=1317129 RepID=A0AAN5C748_9BILA|nr:hypothetical protein PMAYCL1PPCAC_10128 [Pristionchus mayeri]